MPKSENDQQKPGARQSLADWLRDEIRRSEIELSAIASGAEIDSSHLRKFMRGDAGLSLKSADRIAAVIGVEFQRTDLPVQPSDFF